MNHLWPQDARLDGRGELWLGSCAASSLAGEHGTPLYVFSEETLRRAARVYRQSLAQHYPGSAQAAYASKAFLCTAIARLFAEEGLDLDVVSGGELSVALRAGFPPGRIHFHGNNKSPEELAEALAAGVSRIVVDNFHELELLARLAAASGSTPVPVWLRLAPGVQAHTHAHIQTGQEDTKFGFSISAGHAERAVALAMQRPQLVLLGLHAHIGSQIYDPETLSAAAERLVAFAAAMRGRHGFVLRELSPGGGWGVPMLETDPETPVEPYIEMIAGVVTAACRNAGLDLPHLVLEPGRSLIARAGVALYTVGSRKVIPGVRTYVAIDGGMADNIRPALYEARYTALLLNPQDPPDGREPEIVTIAGKYCESGDLLIRDIALPSPRPGDLLAVPMAGAYTLAMSSNYNQALRPAVLMVANGRAHVIQRRESYDDLARRDAGDSGTACGPARRFRAARRLVKYQALGNDYIVLDRREWDEPPPAESVRRICDRRYGVGADGVLWGPLPAPAGAFGLRLYNPDGEEFEVSGNGVRIFARFLWDERLPDGPEFTIIPPAGPIRAYVLDDEGQRIALEMGRLTFDGRNIPLVAGQSEAVGLIVEVRGQPAKPPRAWPPGTGRTSLRITAAGIGNPHCVVFLNEQPPEVVQELGLAGAPTEALARSLGPLLEHLPIYPNRTNVQFAQVIDRHTLSIEIWERGAGYTLASGTSSCAAAGAAVRRGYCESPVTVRMPGGEVTVEIDDAWSVKLTGAVEFVFAGEIPLAMAEA